MALASFAKRSDLGGFVELEVPGFGPVLPIEIPVRPEGRTATSTCIRGWVALSGGSGMRT